jgi:hypothetical protein
MRGIYRKTNTTGPGLRTPVRYMRVSVLCEANIGEFYCINFPTPKPFEILFCHQPFHSNTAAKKSVYPSTAACESSFLDRSQTSVDKFWYYSITAFPGARRPLSVEYMRILHKLVYKVFCQIFHLNLGY